MLAVKTITITIPEELDAAAAAEAARLGTSKSELIRRGLRLVLSPVGEHEADVLERSEISAWAELGGFGGAGVDAATGEIDRVVYGA